MIVFPLTKVVNGNKFFPIDDCGFKEAISLTDLKKKVNLYKMVAV